MKSSDLVIVGGGILGVATAMTLTRRFSDCRITVVEAEREVGSHQTGHNSGVLHSGIYYKPGSDKALNCRRGKALMEQFCTEHEIPWDRCGKVVVATSEEELPRLDRIAERATANGVEYERIHSDQLRELEPAAAGLAALHVPETGIVNYRRVCQKMAELVESTGNRVRLDFEVARIECTGSSLELRSRSGESLLCDHMINCAGLQ